MMGVGMEVRCEKEGWGWNNWWYIHRRCFGVRRVVLACGCLAFMGPRVYIWGVWKGMSDDL